VDLLEKSLVRSIKTLSTTGVKSPFTALVTESNTAKEAMAGLQVAMEKTMATVSKSFKSGLPAEISNAKALLVLEGQLNSAMEQQATIKAKLASFGSDSTAAVSGAKNIAIITEENAKLTLQNLLLEKRAAMSKTSYSYKSLTPQADSLAIAEKNFSSIENYKKSLIDLGKQGKLTAYDLSVLSKELKTIEDYAVSSAKAPATKKLTNKLSSFGGSVDSTVGANSAVLKASSDLEKYNSALEKLGKKGLVSANELKVLKAEIASLNKLLVAGGSVDIGRVMNVGSHIQGLQTATTHTGHFTKANRDLHDALRGVGGASGKLWLTYGEMLPMITGFAVAAGTIKAIKLGVEMEHIATYVEAVDSAAGNSEMSLKGMQEGLLNIKNVSDGPTALGKAMEVMVKAGYPAADALRELGDMSRTATVAQEDLGKVTTFVAQQTRLWSESNVGSDRAMGSLKETANMMTYAVNASSLSFTGLAENLNYAGTAATQTGSDFAEVLAAMASLSNLGLSSTHAGTGMRAAIAAIKNPSQEAKKAIHELGLEFKSLDELGNKRTIAQLFKDVSDGMKLLNPAGQEKLFETVFQLRAAEGATRLISALGDNFDELAESIRRAGIEGTYVNTIFEKLSFTAKEQMNMLGAEVEVAMLRAFSGDALKGFVAQLREFATDGSLEKIISGLLWVVDGLMKAATFAVEFSTVTKALFAMWLTNTILTSVAAVLVPIRQMVLGIKAAEGATIALNIATKANPWILGATILAGVVTTVWSLSHAGDDAARAIEQLKGSIAGMAAAGVGIDEIKNKLIELHAEASKKFIDEHWFGDDQLTDLNDKVVAAKEQISSLENSISSLNEKNAGGFWKKEDTANLNIMNQQLANTKKILKDLSSNKLFGTTQEGLKESLKETEEFVAGISKVKPVQPIDIKGLQEASDKFSHWIKIRKQANKEAEADSHVQLELLRQERIYADGLEAAMVELRKAKPGLSDDELKQTAAYAKSLAIVTKESKTGSEAIKKMAEAKNADATALKALNKPGEEGRKIEEALRKEYDRVLESLDPLRAETERLAVARAAIASINTGNPEEDEKKREELLWKLNQTTIEAIELQKYRTEEYTRAHEASEIYNTAVLEAMPEELRGLAEINKQYDEKIKKIKEASFNMREPPSEEELDKLVNDTNDRRSEALVAYTEKNDEEAQKIAKIWEHAYENMQDITADWLYNMEISWDSLKDLFKKTISQMVSAWAWGQMNMKTTAGVAGVAGVAGTATSAGAATGGSGASSLGMFSGIMNGMEKTGSMISGGVASIGSRMSSAGTDLMFSTSSALRGFGESLGNAGNAISGFANKFPTLSTAGFAGAGAFLLTGIMTGDWEKAAYTGVGSGIGAAIGTIGGPVGVFIGSTLGGIVGGLFGGKKENKFTLSELESSADKTWNRDTGITASGAAGQWTHGNGWYKDIQNTYSTGRDTATAQFNEQVATLKSQMSATAWDVFATALESDSISFAASGRWKLSEAQGALTSTLEGFNAELARMMNDAMTETLPVLAQELKNSPTFAILSDQAITSFNNIIGDATFDVAKYNQLATELQAIVAVTSVIDEAIATSKMSDYAVSLRGINQQFDAYAALLTAAGVDLAKYTSLEEARGIATKKLTDDYKKPVTDLFATDGLSDYGLKLKNLNDKFEEYRVILENTSASEEERTKLLGIYNREMETINAAAALEAQTAALEAQTAALEADANTMIKTYGDLTGAMEELNPAALNLVDAWRKNKAELDILMDALDPPGKTDIEKWQDTLLAGSAMREVVSSIDGKIFDLQAAIDPIGSWKAKESELWAQYNAADVTAQAALAGQIVDATMGRLTAQAALEKTMQEDAKTTIETQISGMQDQLNIATRMKDIVGDIQGLIASLQIGNLSALNPGDQLGVASSQYKSTLSKAKLGDADAAGNLSGFASTYLEEAQSYYGGATSQYAGIFQEVVSTLDQFAKSPLTDVDVLSNQIEVMQKQADSLTEINATNAGELSELQGLRTIFNDRAATIDTQAKTQEGLLRDQIEALKAIVTGQTAEITQRGAAHKELVDRIDVLQASLDSLTSDSALAATAP